MLPRSQVDRQKRTRHLLPAVLALAGFVCAGCGPELSDRGVRLNNGVLEYAHALCDGQRLVALRVDGQAGPVDVDVAGAASGPGLVIVETLGVDDLPSDTSVRLKAVATVGRGVVEWDLPMSFRLDQTPESGDSWLASTRDIKETDDMEASCQAPAD